MLGRVGSTAFLRDPNSVKVLRSQYLMLALQSVDNEAFYDKPVDEARVDFANNLVRVVFVVAP